LIKKVLSEVKNTVTADKNINNIPMYINWRVIYK